MAQEYRTAEQFEEIMDSILNGNWTQGAKECVEYGFYANDLLKAWESTPGDDPELVEDLKDLVLLAEMATEVRYKK